MIPLIDPRSSIRMLLAALAAAACAACSTTPVGPDYHQPADAVASRPEAAAPFAQAASGIYAATPLPPHWWRLYQDPMLDTLVERALAHNTDLRQAVANLERVQAVETQADGAARPSASVQGGPEYGHLSGVDLLAEDYKPPNSYMYGVGAGLSYQIDLFGQIRRGIEAAHAGSEAAQAAVDLVRVNVAAGTARAYAEACASGYRLEISEKSVRLQQKTVDVADRLQQAGRASSMDAARARGQLEQLVATLPPLQAERQGALYRLATLTGALPQEFPREVASCVVPPHVAGTIPVGDGAALLRRRPDIRQAERNLAGATARIGVATGDLYPKISLGLKGASAGEAVDFGGRDTYSWSIGPLISWSLPINGVVHARIAQAEATTRGALAKFDGTVLNALRETETALDAYARELDRRQALQAARDQNAIVAAQARMLYRNGKTGYLGALDAERVLAGSEAALAASEAALAMDQVTLFMALGGGWEPADTPVAAASASR